MDSDGEYHQEQHKEYENEEFAGEVASWGTEDGFNRNSEAEAREEQEDRLDEKANTNRKFGWISLITAIASFFVWPAVLGPIGLILGAISFFNGQRALGIWSMVIGAVTFTSFLFLVPLYS